MQKSIIKIFKGKTKPNKSFVGITNQPRNIKDKFGQLWEGNVRVCLINTRWGQLHVPYTWIRKKIEIIVKEL